jgi:hypothetical protein
LDMCKNQIRRHTSATSALHSSLTTINPESGFQAVTTTRDRS